MERGRDPKRWAELAALSDRINLTDNAERDEKYGLSLWYGSFNLRFCDESQTCCPTWNMG